MKIENQRQLQIALRELDNFIVEGFEGNPEKEKTFLTITKAVEFYEDNVLKLMPLKELETTFRELIDNYLKDVAQVAQIFKEEFGVESSDLLRARGDKRIPFSGAIPHRGVIKYSFHGVGLYTKFVDKQVDFDFYFEEDGFKIDGFDGQRLQFFAENDKIKYSNFFLKDSVKIPTTDFLQRDNIEFMLSDLAKKNIIVKPQSGYSHLWVLNTPQ